MLAAEVTGAGEVAASVPASLAVAAPTGTGLPPVTGATALAAFGREPVVRFPTVESAVNRLTKQPVFAGLDFRTTARAVDQGAFAITTELGDEMVGQVRDILADNIATGPDMGKFISDVQGLFIEDGGLSDARLDMVFRNNVGQALLDGQERALRDPVVIDAFPYRRKFAAHDLKVRPEHLHIATAAGLNGTAIYRMDDPVWETFRGRWSYSCRCSDGPMTVEMAATKGVKEARDWLARAQVLADQFGGVAAQYLGETKPDVPEFVPWPTLNGQRIEPPPEFIRAPGVANFSEWQLAEQASGLVDFAEFREEDVNREAKGTEEGGRFTSKGEERLSTEPLAADEVLSTRQTMKTRLTSLAQTIEAKQSSRPPLVFFKSKTFDDGEIITVQFFASAREGKTLYYGATLFSRFPSELGGNSISTRWEFDDIDSLKAWIERALSQEDLSNFEGPGRNVT